MKNPEWTLICVFTLNLLQSGAGCRCQTVPTIHDYSLTWIWRAAMGTLAFPTHTLIASDATSHKTHQLVHLCTRTRQCAYAHVHTNARTHRLRAYIWTHAYVHMDMNANVCVYENVCVRVISVSTQIHVCARAWMFMHVSVHMNVCVFTSMCTHDKFFPQLPATEFQRPSFPSRQRLWFDNDIYDWMKPCKTKAKLAASDQSNSRSSAQANIVWFFQLFK